MIHVKGCTLFILPTLMLLVIMMAFLCYASVLTKEAKQIEKENNIVAGIKQGDIEIISVEGAEVEYLNEKGISDRIVFGSSDWKFIYVPDFGKTYVDTNMHIVYVPTKGSTGKRILLQSNRYVSDAVMATIPFRKGKI